MEGSGVEPFPLYAPVLQGDAGGAGRSAHVAGHVLHAVPLSPLAGLRAAGRLVAAAGVAGEAHLQAEGLVGLGQHHPRALHPGDHRRHGLLALHPEAARSFLRDNHRHHGGGSPAVGIQKSERGGDCKSPPADCKSPRTACKFPPAGRLADSESSAFRLPHLCHRLSAAGHLWLGRHTADEHLDLAAGATVG